MPKDPPDDYYALLGVVANVDDAELRRVWRQLALEHHPDRAGDASTLTFQRISVAYSVLSDPDARAAYDRWREASGAAPPKPAPRPKTKPSEPAPMEPLPPRAPGIRMGDLCGSLQQLLMRGVADYAPDHDDLIDLFLNAAEVAQGGMITISMRVEVKRGAEIVDELFAAWLAVRPGVKDGTILTPSAWLPGMVHPVYFRVRHRERKH
jgi:curved DNA-binding protein CbpA